jgi:hypothetical protein
MPQRPAWAPDDIDLERPAAARMYDYYLGGSHNFEADRALADENLKVWPDLPHITRANRAFLGRAVSYLCAEGVDQFLDLGAGIPTSGNVHEIAQGVNPAARTVYVDTDPVAVAHGLSLLADEPQAMALEGDLREPAHILGNPAVTGFLDFSRPIAVLMLAVLHFVPDSDDPAGLIAAYRDATAPGSYFAVSHATGDYWPERAKQTEGIYQQSRNAMTFRSREQVAGLMAGYELVPPGLVDYTLWRPAPDYSDAADPLGGDVKRYSGYAAVGRRP